MASPTEAEIITQFRAAVDILDEQLNWTRDNATNLIGLIDTLEQAMEGDWIEDLADGLRSIRSFNDAALRQHEPLLLPILRAWGRIMQTPEETTGALVARLYDRFIATGDRIASRQFTYGAAAAGGGNAGNGTLLRVTRDGRGFDLEACHAEVKTWDCVQDANTRAFRHEEQFQVRGQKLFPDALSVTGSGLLETINAKSARDSLLLNPSFSQFSGTATAPTAITSWTSSIAVNAANYQFITGAAGAAIYRDFVSDTTPYALDVLATANLSQALSVRGTQLDPSVPHLLQVAWNRELGAASGTVTFRMGAQSTAVVVAAQLGWQTTLVPTVFGTNSWYRSFDEQDLDIRIEWARTAGTIRFDDVLFLPMELIDGLYYAPIGGTVPFLREDTFSTTDTEIGAVIQTWVWRMLGDDPKLIGVNPGPVGYLPSAVGAGITIADP